MRKSRADEDQVESGLKFGDVTPTETADRELRWFFNEADAECEQPSNYGCMLGGTSPVSMSAVEARAEAVHAAGKIKKWLGRVSETDVPMLAGVYREKMWPEAVETALGPLAGAVAALPTVRVLHLRALTNARTEADSVAEWIAEQATERPEVLAAWRREAERNCAIAIRAYERERGKGECVVPDEEVG